MKPSFATEPAVQDSQHAVVTLKEDIMPYARPIQIPTNKTVLTQPVVMTKRVACPRRSYRNNRKLQAIPGQIVYITRGKRAIPMRVICIDDCYIWSTGAKWQDRSGYIIYYDLQPLTKATGEWRARRYQSKSRATGWREHNNRICKQGWIGHAIDMDEFFHTCAEANWSLYNRIY